jgi:homoserine kinase type II
MRKVDHVRQVLEAYPAVSALRSEALGSSGGFSGASLWRIYGRGGDWCLRRWPAEHPDEARLQFIHSVLHTVFERGVHEIPLPLSTRHGTTWLRHDGCLWELTPWMPGRADFHQDSRPEKLQAALEWLARFHGAAAPFPPQVGPSPGIVERLDLLRRLKAGERSEIEKRLPSLAWPELVLRARRILAAFDRRAANVETLLADAARLACPLQPCIRDIWHDHVLFEGARVAGVVDFGALRVECVSGDIARLLGSLVGDEAPLRRLGLEAYCGIRRLHDAERRLVTAFDVSGVLLSGMNWLRWICLQERRFEHPAQVLARLDEILLRLDRPQSILVD